MKTTNKPFTSPIEVRGYGDGKHLIAYIPKEHPRLANLKKMAAWVATYTDCKQKGKIIAFDLAFEYKTARERNRLWKWLTSDDYVC